MPLTRYSIPVENKLRAILHYLPDTFGPRPERHLYLLDAFTKVAAGIPGIGIDISTISASTQTIDILVSPEALEELEGRLGQTFKLDVLKVRTSSG